MPTITHLTSLPATIPPGGAGVVLVDGRVARNGLQGPGRVTPDPWQKGFLHKQPRIELLLFPTRDLRLAFTLADLRTRDGISLDLDIRLALHIADPVQFITGLLRKQEQVSQQDLTQELAGALHTSLAALFRRFTLEELDAKPDLRDWLTTAADAGLQDPMQRVGLTLTSVEAYNLRCWVTDQVDQRREALYLKAALAQVDARGARLLDERVLAEIRQHVPVKRELVAHKEELADLYQREIEANARLETLRTDALQSWLKNLGAASRSILSPELWRKDLNARVLAEPLLHSRQLFIITDAGALHAFDAASGQPLWAQPMELGVRPGQGMVMAAGLLWIPGRDGKLYGVAPGDAQGALHEVIPIGGSLSAAPLLANDLLFLSLDADMQNFGEGGGQIVAVDVHARRIAGRWRVSQSGLRAQPAILGNQLFVGDRKGAFFALDIRRGRVRRLFDGGGLILAPALADARRGRVFVGDHYGFLHSFDASGRALWSHAPRLPGRIVGRPLLYRHILYAGDSTGQVHALDPNTGQPLGEPYATGGPIVTAPVAWEDWLFIASNDGYLYALDIATPGRFQPFWMYFSGSPIVTTPALDAQRGRLFMVDAEGRLNALPWHETRYADAARSMQNHPTLSKRFQAIFLWGQAGALDAAMQLAEGMGRYDLAGEMAARLNWRKKAAQSYERMARMATDPIKAAAWWQQAAEQWLLEGEDDEAQRCLLADAQARNAPLLAVEVVGQPRLIAGEPTSTPLRLRVRNLTAVLAREVQLTFEGDLSEGGGKMALGGIGPEDSKFAELHFTPSLSGHAQLILTLHYYDARGKPQRPLVKKALLSVSHPPQVHNHYHGPVITGDGVIIMRGAGASGRSRTICIQSDGDEIEIGRS